MFTKKQLIIELIKILGRAVLSVIVAAVVIYLLSGQITGIGQTAKENRTAVAILDQKNLATNNLKSDLALVGNGDEKIEEAFIKAENIVTFIDKLEKTAEDNGFEQILRFEIPVSIVDETGKDDVSKMLDLMKVDYSITLKGDAASFNEYLEEFEKLPYFSNIVSLTADYPSLSGWDKEATILIRAELYLRK